MPATFRCYQLKRSKDARKRCINLMSPKYSVIVAENKGFSSRNYLGLFFVDLGLFGHFLPGLALRARFQASSGYSDSANRPGYEAARPGFPCSVGSVCWAIRNTTILFWVCTGFVRMMRMGIGGTNIVKYY